MRDTLLVILIISLLAGGALDCEEEERQELIYCEMVNDGHWPNYKEIDCQPEKINEN